MANEKGPSMGMKMSMRMGRLGGDAGEPWIGQIQTISPPIANTIEEAVASAPGARVARLNESALDDLGNYLTGQDPNKPYTDSQITTYMRSLGYNFTRREVTIGKAILRSRTQNSS